jgi:hypothetical protein
MKERTNLILVCASNARELDFWRSRAGADGARFIDGYRATFAALHVELRFMVFDPRDRGKPAERLRGLELGGVLNLEAVLDEECRSMIFARIRP